MKAIISVLLVLVMSLVGCSSVASNPFIEEQQNIAMNSMRSAIIKSIVTPWNVKILKINAEDFKHVFHPSVKKTIRGVQYDAWPLKVDGTAITELSSNTPGLRFRQSYFVRISYVAYCYVNDVGERKFTNENIKIESHKI